MPVEKLVNSPEIYRLNRKALEDLSQSALAQNNSTLLVRDL